MASASAESLPNKYGILRDEVTLARKFRDEKRPRAGLLRGREFLMKDMYSFDLDEDTALATYNDVRDAYDWFFSSIGLPFVTVSSSKMQLTLG